MRIYEELFIVRPDSTEEEIDVIIDQVKSTVTNAGGTIDKEEKWGVRKLAYKVQKRSEGYYVLIQFTAGAQTVHEIERRLRVSDAVMKFITVRIVEKRKKAREKRAHRKPAPVAAAPAMPTAEQQMMASPAMPGEPVHAAPAAPAPAAPAVAEPVAEKES
jgi:small subunit ribosomal protein S6